MSERVLWINFKFNVSGVEYKQAVAPLANDIAAFAGLRWKVWTINEVESEAGGFYVFDDEASVNAYLDSPIVDGIVNHPALSDFSVKQFDVLEEQTAITRGPIREHAPAQNATAKSSILSSWTYGLRVTQAGPAGPACLQLIHKVAILPILNVDKSTIPELVQVKRDGPFVLTGDSGQYSFQQHS